MKKVATCLLLAFLINGAAHAQKGRNEVKLLAEGSTTLFDPHLGWGGFVKGYYGLGRSGQLTLTTGLIKFKSEIATGKSNTRTHLIPVLLGYKQHIGLFYIEPQAGLGEMGGRVDWGGDYSRPSATTVYASLGAGVDIKKFEIGVRYQYAKGIDAATAGIWSNRKFELAALHVGYKIF